MRQYVQVREEKRREHKKFSYKNIKEVYTIVLMMESTEEFHKFPDDYLHYFQQTSNTGLKLDLLQNYLLIPLDIFQKKIQNRDRSDHKLPAASPQEEGACWEGPAGKLEAWLTFISSDRPGDILRVLNTYPEFRELYKEVFEFRYQKKELISMYSEALRILDANTIEYMAEQQRKQIRRLNKKLEKKKKILDVTTQRLDAKTKDLEATTRELETKERDWEDRNKKLEQEVRRLTALLNEKQDA